MSACYIPSLKVVCLVVANAGLIIAIIIAAAHLGNEVNYRSAKEFLLQLQRVYDTAVYSLFDILIFFIITNLISFGMRLKVTMDSVNYITQQVDDQRKECEETVRRFVCDAFFVRKYYENKPTIFEPVETLSIQQAVSKHKEVRKERSIDETVKEINKQLKMLKKMNTVMNQPEAKQFDSNFVKLIEELNGTGQTIIGKDVSRIKQVNPTYLRSILRANQAGRKYKSGYIDLTQYSIKDQKSRMITDKTQLSAVKSPSSHQAKTSSQSRKSISPFSSTNRGFRAPSSKVAEKILGEDKTQSSLHRTSQNQVTVNLSTPSKKSAKMMKLLKPSKTTLPKSSISQNSLKSFSGYECCSTESSTQIYTDSVIKTPIKEESRENINQRMTKRMKMRR
ncbi:putative integral membrane protein [Brugia pahangi]